MTQRETQSDALSHMSRRALLAGGSAALLYLASGCSSSSSGNQLQKLPMTWRTEGQGATLSAPIDLATIPDILGDASVNTSDQNKWPNVALLSTDQLPYEQVRANGLRAAAAFFAPDSQWHIGIAGPKGEFGSDGDNHTLVAARLGHDALRMVLGSTTEENVFSPFPTRVTTTLALSAVSVLYPQAVLL